MLLFLFLLFFFENSAAVLNTVNEDFKKISDNAAIQISLKNYNMTSADGDSVELFYTLPPKTISKIELMNVPTEAYFVVLQVHSYLVNVTLSYTNEPVQGNSITGTNVGLVKLNDKAGLSFFLTYNNSFEDVDIMVSVQAYPVEAPVPGGCNMEFQVEVSPFLLTTYNYVVTEVNFAPSAPPVSVLNTNPTVPDECNIKPSPVHHKMYYRYFPERDFSRETYFSMLKSLMTTGRILKNGKLAPEKLKTSPMRRIFATYPGTGNAFVVISEFKNRSVVYVPSFSYGCDVSKNDNECLVLTTTFSKVVCAIILFIGLFTCFFGHFFFQIELFCFGFLAWGIVTYVLVSILFSIEIAFTTSVVFGVFATGSTLIVWNIFGLPIIPITVATLTFGFLLLSIIYFPLIDYVDLLVFDLNFWGIFIGFVVSCPVLMLYLAEKANVISSAFVGTYVGLLSIDHYIGSNLRYIVINTISRATFDEFKFAIVGPPFQLKDALLCVVWAILTFSGIKIQRLLTRNKPPYPPPMNPMKKFFKNRIRPSPVDNQPDEKTPFLPCAPNTLDFPPNYQTHYNGNNYV